MWLMFVKRQREINEKRRLENLSAKRLTKEGV